MKKDKTDRLNKEFYATTALFNNGKKREELEARLYGEKKKQPLMKKESPTVREREEKKMKTKILQKKFM